MSASPETPKGLLLFSIGPVQDFIATARRTQDLWMGSYILAHLSYKAMEAIQEQSSYDASTPEKHPDPILFPVLDDHPFTKLKTRRPDQKAVRSLTIASLPNKFTVRINSADEGERFARAAQERVHNEWREIAASVQAKIPGSLINGIDWSETWNTQIDPENWLEIYWVVQLNPEQQYSFKELNARSERALQARKGMRNFTPATEWGERDSLSGRRAALSSPPQQSRRKLRAQWKALGEALYREGVKKGDYSGLSAALSTEGHEYLSAVDMTKRFAQRFFFDPNSGLKGQFPSTSSIASAVFRKSLLADGNLQSARMRFVAGLKTIKGEDGQRLPTTLAEKSLPALFAAHDDDTLLKYDGELFYPDTYTEKRLKDDFNVPFSETAVSQLKQNLLSLRTAAANAGINTPPTYYALLLMDGDNMGKHMAAIDTVDGQRQISRQLMAFALEKVQTIVEDKHLGRVVYAGGDDLMAFLPLESVLDAAQELNAIYRNTLNPDAPQFTASAGIAIAHHLAPLDRVLQAAREAEKMAKGKYGRNSVVFSILKRSGEQLNVGGQWDFEGAHPLLPTVRKVRDDLQNKTVGLSPKFAFDAQEEAMALTNMHAAHEARLALLLKRHSKKLEDSERIALAATLAHIGAGIQKQFDDTARSAADAEDTRSGTVEVARWLLLARFFVAATNGEE